MLDIRSKEVDNSIVIELNGRIIYDTEEKLKTFLKNVLNEINVKNIIINLNKLTYINSSGIGILVKFLRDTKDRNIKLILCEPKDTIYEVFKITNLTQVFNIKEKLEDAIKFVNQNVL